MLVLPKANHHFRMIKFFCLFDLVCSNFTKPSHGIDYLCEFAWPLEGVAVNFVETFSSKAFCSMFGKWKSLGICALKTESH